MKTLPGTSCPRCLLLLAAAGALLSSGGGELAAGPGDDRLREAIERHETDLEALERYHRIPFSEKRRERLGRFYEEESRALEGIDFETLSQEGRIDYLLLRNRLRFRLKEAGHQEKLLGEVSSLVPFAASITRLEEARRRMEPIQPESSAEALTGIGDQIDASRKALEERVRAGKEKEGAPIPRAAANRAAAMVDGLRQALKRWHDFYSGYHPEFTWWARAPFQRADKKLEDHASFLRKSLAGFTDGEDPPIIGDPIGRAALLDALESEMIPYTPEELIEIAEKEFAWCEAEYRRAAQEMGLGDDWRKALERVKGLHKKPGEQPGLIRDLAEEAVRFLEERDLVTIPPLCKETWRMEMMSPERQKVNPYFTGGEVISVSFPTETMSYEDKLMSLRGNNIHFCRATVHHELIPGHHLQAFMAARHRTHRRAFRTPFLVEGWPLYWEMLLWDLGFPRSPEDRVGMLFWRSHRSARIVFSLGFHLGKLTPQEAIDYLVERVGHERRNATAEVRRSVAGDYGPLYQAAYLLGGLQIRALRRELVESGKMKDRQFHDAILKENAIPVELIRASLTGLPLTRDHSAQWRFYETKPKADPPAPGAERAGTGPQREGGSKPSPGRRVFRDRLDPHWFGDARFWYRLDLPGESREFIVVDAGRGTREPAFDHRRLAQALSQASGKTVAPDRLPFESIEFAPDGKAVRLEGKEGSFSLDLETYRISDAPAAVKGTEGAEKSAEKSDPPPREERRRRRRPPRSAPRSPDGRWEAFVRGADLQVRELPAGAERPLTRGGSDKETYAVDSHRDQAIELESGKPPSEPARPDAYWSPDSRRLVAMRTRPGAQRLVYLVESSPRDQLQPRLHSYPYLKPGDEIPVKKPHLFDVEAGLEIPIDDALFPDPWSIEEVRWSPDSSRFTFLYNQRGHQVLRIVAVDARTGAARSIVEEKSATFIDYAGKRFTEHLEDTGEIIWMSERDGWNHLYLYDAATGQVKNRITSGDWVVRSVESVEPEKSPEKSMGRRRIYFQAGGIRPGQDPYHVHHCRVDLDGGGLVVLTEGDGTHAVQFSPDRRYFIDTWSRVDQPPVIELRRGDDGGLVLELERAEAGTLLASGWRPPERFTAKGRDGLTDIHGLIHRSLHLDPGKKYPVIESIYAGPQGSFVPKSFRASHGQEELAELGFIVVQIDGMGTSHRSKKFHDVCWKNLGDSGFPDRILWMKAAAARYPYLDLSRVGIYGGSAGGQSAARAVLAHGDFYKVAVADSGCHDNRMDKIWWNELWMGWPVGAHYAEQSNVTQAHRLEGKLMLIVGELDRNVDPSSTLQLVNALIKADKDFDLLFIPGGEHGAGRSRYGWRRQKEFFARHLLGAEPRRPETVE